MTSNNPDKPFGELPSVSVVIPALECATRIRGCIKAVAAQTYEGPVDVTVALARSADNTDEVLAELVSELALDLPIRVIDNPAVTTPAGLNRAVAESTGTIVARADAQCRLPPDYIEKAVGTMLRTGAANVGGVQRPISATRTGRAAAIATALASTFGGGPAAYRLGHREGRTDTVYLGVFNRAVLEEIGGFNELLDRNQDYELNWRLRQAGHVVWLDPSLIVDYLPRDNYRDLATQYFRFGAWKRTMLMRNPRSLKLRQLVPLALLVGLAVSVLEILRGRIRGAALPLAYSAACVASTVSQRSSLPQLVDRLRAAAACALIHLSWATGFFLGRTRR